MRRIKIAAAALAICSAGLIIVSGCTGNAKHDTPPAADAIIAAADFVGNAACEECHKQEFTAHKDSRHDVTLHLAEDSLGRLAPPVGRIMGGKTSVVPVKGGLAFEVNGKRSKPIQLAFSSGKTGVTYVTDLGEDQLRELHWSWFPEHKRWWVTPGHEKEPDTELGGLKEGEFPRKCIQCHAITVPIGSTKPEKRFLGVGCESCHGPGSAHIAAARAKQKDLRLENLGGMRARDVNRLCARCHDTNRPVDPAHIASAPTQRLQYVGLRFSPCARANPDTFSCTTCHDAHTNVENKESHYVQVCLNCHSGKPAAPVNGIAIRTGRVCSVNATDKCVKCHMPIRPLSPGTDFPIKMADHLIRIHPELRQARGISLAASEP